MTVHANRSRPSITPRGPFSHASRSRAGLSPRQSACADHAAVFTPLVSCKRTRLPVSRSLTPSCFALTFVGAAITPVGCPFTPCGDAFTPSGVSFTPLGDGLTPLGLRLSCCLLRTAWHAAWHAAAAAAAAFASELHGARLTDECTAFNGQYRGYMRLRHLALLALLALPAGANAAASIEALLQQGCTVPELFVSPNTRGVMERRERVA